MQNQCPRNVLVRMWGGEKGRKNASFRGKRGNNTHTLFDHLLTQNQSKLILSNVKGCPSTSGVSWGHGGGLEPLLLLARFLLLLCAALCSLVGNETSDPEPTTRRWLHVGLHPRPTQPTNHRTCLSSSNVSRDMGILPFSIEAWDNVARHQSRSYQTVACFGTDYFV